MRTVGVEEELLVVDPSGSAVPLAAALAAAGDEPRVTDGVAELLRRGTGAHLQRAIHRQTGDPHAVVRAAVEITHDSAAAVARNAE